MRARRRWIAVGLGITLALGIAGYLGVSYYGYDALTAATPRCNDRFPDRFTPASFGTEGIAPEFTKGGFDTRPYAMPGYQDVSFPSRDARQPRLTIRAWWVPAEEADAPAVIVVHGINSCRHDPVVLLPAGMLARNGFSVLMMDLRDQGDSDIEDGRSGWGSEEYLDILGAWDWLQSAQGLQASRIGLMGESLGAASAIIAMGEERAIAATWADSGFADLGVLFDERIARERFPAWLRPGVIAWGRIIANDDLLARRPVEDRGTAACHRPRAQRHRPRPASREGSRRRARDVRLRLRALARPPGAPPPGRVRRAGRVRATDCRVLPGRPRGIRGASAMMNRAASLYSFRAVLLPLLVAGTLAGCGPDRITVPPGAQVVHVVVNGDSVRLDPATVRAGDVYLVIDSPGTGVTLVERMSTPDESPGPLSDAELDRVAHGDTFHTGITCCFENGAQGNVGKLVVAPGSYVFVTDDPTALAEKSGGVISPQSMGVLRVEP